MNSTEIHYIVVEFLDKILVSKMLGFFLLQERKTSCLFQITYHRFTSTLEIFVYFIRDDFKSSR